MNGKLSNVFKSEIGGRQGDNLSPLLFSIYLSDLESFLSSKYGGLAYISELTENDDDLYEYIKLYIILYADDTVILAESPTELQMSLDAMQSIVLNLPIDLQLDLFNKLVTPILLYRSEIRAYENNDIIEKLHLGYCKYILSVNKSTTSSMVYGELSGYPLNIEYTSRCIFFLGRIISGPVSKLSVKMYNLLYKMYNLGIYNSPWLSFVKSTLISAGFGYVWRDQKIPRTLEYFKKVFKIRLKDQYIQTWTDDVASNAKCIN